MEDLGDLIIKRAHYIIRLIKTLLISDTKKEGFSTRLEISLSVSRRVAGRTLGACQGSHSGSQAGWPRGSPQARAPRGWVSAILCLVMAHAAGRAGASRNGAVAAREAQAWPAAPGDAACAATHRGVRLPCVTDTVAPDRIYLAPRMHTALDPREWGLPSSSRKTTSSHPAVHSTHAF